VPLLGKGLKKMSQAALERQNPELASAVRKLERLGANRDPRRAQQALAQLSKAEREAFLEAAGEEMQQQGPQAVNRAQRRQLQKQRKRR
jgi:predicted Zn-dependent peptidase